MGLLSDNMGYDLTDRSPFNGIQNTRNISALAILPSRGKGNVNRFKRIFGCGDKSQKLDDNMNRRSKKVLRAARDSDNHGSTCHRPSSNMRPLLGVKMAPRYATYLPEIGEGRRKSSDSDYLHSDDEKGPTAIGTARTKSASFDRKIQVEFIASTKDNIPLSTENNPASIHKESPRSKSDGTTYERKHSIPSACDARRSTEESKNSTQGGNFEDCGTQPLNGDRSPSSCLELPPCQEYDLGSLRTQSQVVEAAVPNCHPVFRNEWATYLKDYCEGRFNIISPPSPPSKRATFKFLPSMSPQNEEGRLASLKRCNPVWTSWQEDRGKSLVQLAQEEFGASGVSISFVDSNIEILKVEMGYNRRTIRRPESIAAHVLLSTEVLVVLDTAKDWRFAGNPLVVNEPAIRFFAGAPMLSPNSEVIGVFAIFGREPRDSFTAMQRRQLTNYSAASVTDLTSILDHGFSESNFEPSMYKEQPDSYGGAQPDTEEHFEEYELEGELIHGMVQDQRDLETNTPLTYSSLINDMAYAGTSSASERIHSDEHFLFRHSNEFDKNHKHLFPPADPNRFIRNKEEVAHGSPVFRNVPPRPFSGSDLTSVDGNPHPNSPAESIFDDDDSLSFTRPQEIIEHTLSLDLSAFQMPTSETDTSSPVNHVPSRRVSQNAGGCSRNVSQKSRSRGRDPIASRYTANKNFGSGSTETQESFRIFSATPSPATTATHSFASSRVSSLDFMESDKRVVADYAAMLAANELNFDRIYAAEFIPKKTPSTTDELLNGGMNVRILGSHNCPPDTKLDVAFHLHVLRSRGGAVKWQDVDALPGAQTKGFLMRLSSGNHQGGSQECIDKGIVYGAFRTAPLNTGESSEITNQEQTGLIEAANEMRTILLKKPTRKEAPITNGQLSPPISPDTMAFPANEAKEVGINGSGLEGMNTHEYPFKVVGEELNLAWDREE